MIYELFINKADRWEILLQCVCKTSLMELIIICRSIFIFIYLTKYMKIFKKNFFEFRFKKFRIYVTLADLASD